MKLQIISGAAFLFMTGTASADGPHDVFAIFSPPAGTSHVEISDCGDGTPCGTIVWIDPASLPDGETPEEVVSANGERVLGLTMLEGFEEKRKDWRGGTVYDPENDKLYAARIKRLDDGSLQLKGCIGPFCQTQVWSHVSQADAQASAAQ